MMLVWVGAHTLAIYLFLIVVLRSIGRREIAQLTLLDYLTIALLGSAVETGLYLGSGSLWAGLVSATTLLLANRGLTMAVNRSSWLRRLLVGVPIVLVHDGRIIPSHLRLARLTEENLLAAIRLRGYDGVEAVRFAVIEPNGKVGVVPREERKDTRQPG